ncbi:MAG: UPF0175 family protein, partial [Methanosarcinales archaeon]|nr:UPF0175 family protein [Methanosarcinales archaeon]
ILHIEYCHGRMKNRIWKFTFIYHCKRLFNMRVITTRVPDEMFDRITELEESENIDRAEATRKLLFIGIKEIKKEKAIKLLRAYKITYRKAAEMMGVAIYELLDIMEKEGIEVGYSMRDLEKDLEEMK